MTRLIDLIEWKRISIPSGAAKGRVDLTIGSVGEGNPLALVTAGIHGDEGPWSAWAMNKMLRSVIREELRGALRIVPVANPLAMEADARCSPLDNLDLNRAFPGRVDGSHTECLAAALTQHALRNVDVVIDLHGGGSWCVNAFAFQFKGSEQLARAFQPPFLVKGHERSTTLTGFASSTGARVTAVEIGGRSQFEHEWTKRLANGLRKALGVAGIIMPVTQDPCNTESIEVGPTRVLRPSRGGVFMPKVEADRIGTVVSGGSILGHLLDPITMKTVETFEAPFCKTALLLLRPRLAVIEGGAMTYVVAPL